MISWMDQSASSSALRVVMTVLDDQVGYPINPRLLDRAFFIRIPSRDALPLGDVNKTVESADITVSLDALSEMFKTDRALPAQIEDRISTLIEATNRLGVPLSERTITDVVRYVSAVLPYMTCPPLEVLDYALSQRAVPYLLATARVEALEKLPEILCDMKKSIQLMNEPLALPPLE